MSVNLLLGPEWHEFQNIGPARSSTTKNCTKGVHESLLLLKKSDNYLNIVKFTLLETCLFEHCRETELLEFVPILCQGARNAAHFRRIQCLFLHILFTKLEDTSRLTNNTSSPFRSRKYTPFPAIEVIVVRRAYFSMMFLLTSMVIFACFLAGNRKSFRRQAGTHCTPLWHSFSAARRGIEINQTFYLNLIHFQDFNDPIWHSNSQFSRTFY